MCGSEPVVIIIEDNATRAELYELWLPECTVRIALTREEVESAVGEDVSVAILAEEFADGAAPEVHDLLAAQAPTCEVVTTSDDRTKVCPDLDVDHHLTEPVFKDELRELVERLVVRVRYRRRLVTYFELTARLTTAEVKESAGEGQDDRRPDLEQRVADLKTELERLRGHLSSEDVHDVLAAIVDRRRTGAPAARKRGSKYAPDRCSRCKTEWNVGPGDDPARGYRKLGAYVWRCVECGHVQMQSDPSHQRLAPYQ